MYEKLKLHYDILQFYMKENDYDNILNSCFKYGENDSNMWIQVLSYFASGKEEFKNEISKILTRIEKDDILPPLLVIQILSNHKRTTLGKFYYKIKKKIGTVKEYIEKKLKQEQLLIEEDLKKIKELQTETIQMKKEIDQLKSSAKIFQLTNCTFCNSQLDLPASHFMCGHSYHQRYLFYFNFFQNRCLSDTDECYKCSKKNKEVYLMKKKFEESSNQHEQFFKQFKSSKPHNGFSVVTEYFGRGIFDNINKDINNEDVDDDDENIDENSN
jgi:hypothetical protein